MRRWRVPLAIVWPIALLALVGLLATLQYRWLGEVSAAERAGMQTSLRSHADDFARDFDREIIRAYLAIQSDGPALQRGEWKPFADDLDAWRASTHYPQLIQNVYLVRGPQHELLRFQADTGTFVAEAWPAQLDLIKERLTAPPPTPDGRTLFFRSRSPILPSVPALIASIPVAPMAPVVQAFSAQSTAVGLSGAVAVKRDLDATTARLMAFTVEDDCVIATIDREYVRNTMLPDLAARYFPESTSDQPRGILARSEGYRLAVVPDDDLAHPLYARGFNASSAIDIQRADADVPFFALRPDMVEQLVTRDKRTVFSYSSRSTDAPIKFSMPSSGAGAQTSGQISIMLKATPSISVQGAPTSTANTAYASTGAWQLVLQHSAGSLDAAVSEGRRRNLTMSFGVLALLAASVGLIAINAQRAQRLAAQQMDFVATVSHELRTPLAVIRSAAQNLSAGVVHDAAQAKRYGDLIDMEGKRLTDMVEQVLEFAGLAGDRRPLNTRAVDAVSLVRDVLASCEGLLQSEGFRVEVHAAEHVPAVAADEGALRRALNNLVSNAVKYGSEGRWIGVTIEHASVRGSSDVHIAVSDHGQGIDPADLPHIFEPFYRGRYATERQIHGNGLGLSLVSRIASAHGGRISVRSALGEGTTFTLTLPSAAPDPAVSGLANPEAHGSATA